MRIDPEGWLDTAERCPSPNFDARPEGAEVVLIVIHAISLPPGNFGGPYIADLFLNRLDPLAHDYFSSIATLRVSAHFLIRRDGRVVQFVAGNDRAWHAGTSCWQGIQRCNDFSVGIELEGCDELPFETVQYETLNRLIAALCSRYPIRGITGHSDIAPGRKTDPGPCFEWAKISRIDDFFSRD